MQGQISETTPTHGIVSEVLCSDDSPDNYKISSLFCTLTHHLAPPSAFEFRQHLGLNEKNPDNGSTHPNISRGTQETKREIFSELSVATRLSSLISSIDASCLWVCLLARMENLKRVAISMNGGERGNTSRMMYKLEMWLLAIPFFLILHIVFLCNSLPLSSILVLDL